ncbi:hypothetical protein F9B85_08830 [Heliorestis acidaminivorans]|uniref:DUF2357 domain-containing protein n=1 Tax=Heliorestis acidaminivorans TaxID=553427 RepID=A0A6I0ERJ5_9FIRM|nr:DUF2357 domain-containing protein [Heliorestis acidaminivorans]KAB2952263.1 hypothetical protein F9B85_08830 [Heliorestis acidaminivorans]
MAIQSEQTNFSLAFMNGDRFIAVKDFYEQEKELYQAEASIKILENLNLSLIFYCSDSKARFYMDGLETLPERMVLRDEEGQAYLPPGEQECLLFRYEDYPLIPGYYKITIVTSDRTYHALLQVLPKQMTQAQWESMKEELEKELQELALHLFSKNLGQAIPALKDVPSRLWFRFMMIQKSHHVIISALNDLYSKANYKVSKNRTFDYDLPENRWLRRIIRTIEKNLQEFALALQEQEDTVKTKRIERNGLPGADKRLPIIKNYQEQCIKLLHSFRFIRQAPWFNQVGLNVYSKIPLVMMTDFRYRTLYKLYKDLQKEKVEVALDRTYQYQWKRTDLLYENWGFLKICRALMQEPLNFEVKSGWLFDLNFTNNHLLIPSLPSGTTIILEKDKIKLHLVYDALIPRKSEQTDKYIAPLYIKGTHDRPDGRIDIYKEEIYAGSVLFDFKYRPLKNFWDPQKIDAPNRPGAMRQLLAYGAYCKSPYLMGDVDDFLRRHIGPVPEVWAIYPTDYDEVVSSRFYEDYDLRLIKMCPGTDLNHVGLEINQVVKAILYRLDIYSSLQSKHIG